jgi:hypothetical protein
MLKSVFLSLMAFSGLSLGMLSIVSCTDSSARALNDKALAYMAASEASPANGDVFVKGLDGCITYCPAVDGEGGRQFGFSSGGQEFKVSAIWYGGCVVVAVEGDNSRRDILYIKGKVAKKSVAGFPYPLIGFSKSGEAKDNEYVIGAHDFTNDGSPELVVAHRDAAGVGIAIFVFQFDGGSWFPIGEIVTNGKGLGSPRVFRQAITLRSDETLYTWTFHGSKFDFAASDGTASPKQLF